MATVYLCPHEKSSSEVGMAGNPVDGGRYGKCQTYGNGAAAIYYVKPQMGLPKPTTGIRFGAAMRFIDSLTSGTNGWLFPSSSGSGLKFSINDDGTVAAKYSSTVLGTSTQALVLDQWYYVEAFIKPGAIGVGRMTLVVDGETWLDISDKAMGSPPTGTGNDYDIFVYAPQAGSVFIDDSYYIPGDTPGFLGDITVTELALSGVESNTGWSPGTTVFPETSDTAGERIVYTVAAPPPELTGEPLAAFVMATATNTGGTTFKLALSDGVNPGTPMAVGTSATYIVANPTLTDLSELKISLESST